MKKGDILNDLIVEGMAAEGQCVARHNGQVVFIKGVAPGDIVDIELTKIKTSFLEGKVKSISKLSPERITPFCGHFGLCGGCTWQHINYSAQLEYKQKQVADHFEHIGGLSFPAINPIIPSAQTQHYRNRLDFTFTANRWMTKAELETGKSFGEPGLGFHIPKMFDRVFNVEECHLQPDPSNAIRLETKVIAIKENIPFFDLRKQTGFLRNLTIRTSNLGEVMVILQVADENVKWTELILEGLCTKFPAISSVNFVINRKRNDTFSDLSVVCWRGNPYITESMSVPSGEGTLQFRVGPKSFYQTNSAQAFQLYNSVFRMARFTGQEIVYDLYTGTGTIANFIARQVSRVVGLEYVEAAIEDAKINSSLNNITNTSFFAGDIKDLLNEDFLQTHGRPDVIITDPPRVGMHEGVCKMILHASPSCIVYVSCNPATQARDLKILTEKYEIKEVQPIDMFPHTIHVENIVRLDLRH